SGGNWAGAGDYCWDEAGMANGATNTLYSCGSAGGLAAVKTVCGSGCQHMPAGQNDQCQVSTGPLCATGANWHGAGDYCGDQPGLTNTAAGTLYSCAAEGGTAAV